MGLDMYLQATKYVGGWNHDGGKQPEFDAMVGLTGIHPTKEAPSFNITATVAYWRKANAIHNWFVENCQEGKDECQTSYVSRKQLAELRDSCRNALSCAEMREGVVNVGTAYGPDGVRQLTEPGQLVTNKAQVAKILPTKGGFFFGGTDYDEAYIDDLKETADTLDRLLSDKALATYDFEYHASW